MRLSELHPGIHRCPIRLVEKYMPEVLPILETCPGLHNDSVVDVKVHMLMPNQFPCIPGWHCDLVPRDENLKQKFDKVQTDQFIWLWVSNNPLPEFRDGREVKAETWIPFTQLDWHRGTVSQEHCWRMFIRVAQESIYKPNPESKILRRHSQVYLDSERFKW